MKSMVQASVLAIAVAWPAALAAPTSAQVSPDYRNSKVVLFENQKGDGGYWTTTAGVNPPKELSAERKELRDKMMKRRVLEEYAEFLSPLRLPHTLRLFASDCRGNEWDSPYYSSGLRAINMCYSFIAAAEKDVDYLLQLQTRQKLWTPVSREQLIAGLFVAVLLHETGHAVFDLMDVPLFGRGEDAADQMAAFIALQFDKETARTIVKGFAYFWALQGDPNTTAPDKSDPKYPKDAEGQCRADPFCAYSDEHGTSSQRMYNVLCIAYGGDRDNFKDFVEAGWLPEERAKTCPEEYEQLRIAFRKTILPFVDEEQMKKVRTRKWFQPTETRER